MYINLNILFLKECCTKKICQLNYMKNRDTKRSFHLWIVAWMID